MQNIDINWDDLRFVLALLSGGSLSAAAQSLTVTPSTVGRRLDGLEERLGVRLFDRTPEGASPTAAAESMRPYAEQMEGAVHEVARVVAGFEAEPEGEVRLSVPPGLADHFVAPLLPRLLAQYPKLRIDLDASIGYTDLTRREADLALRDRRPARGDLIAKRLVDAPDVPMASPDYARRLGSLRAWNQARWVTWGPSLAHLSGARWISEHVDDASVVFRTNSMSAQIEAVREGLGVCLFPDAYARRPGLTPLRVSKSLMAQAAPMPENTLWLVGHRALRHVPRIDAVWRFLVAEFRRPADGEAA